VKAQTTLPRAGKGRNYGFTFQIQGHRKLKEKSNKIICSGCGAEMGERKRPNEIPYGICDVCLRAIHGEEDLVFSERQVPGQDLLPWDQKNNCN
jgi:hypothetical protein